MDWVRATLSEFFFRLAARVSASTPTATPPPVSRQPESAGQSSDQQAGGGRPLSPRAIESRPPLDDFSGFRITLEALQPNGSWQFVSMEMLNERARQQLLAFAQLSLDERQVVVDHISDFPLPDLDQPTVVH